MGKARLQEVGNSSLLYKELKTARLYRESKNLESGNRGKLD